MTQLIVFNIFNGLIVGAFYALMALGLSLILNLSGVINFAHGGFLALGAYIAYSLLPYTGFWGAQSVPFQIPAALTTPLSSQFFFLTGYRIFMVLLVAAAVIGLFVILNKT